MIIGEAHRLFRRGKSTNRRGGKSNLPWCVREIYKKKNEGERHRGNSDLHACRQGQYRPSLPWPKSPGDGQDGKAITGGKTMGSLGNRREGAFKVGGS